MSFENIFLMMFIEQNTEKITHASNELHEVEHSPRS